MSLNLVPPRVPFVDGDGRLTREAYLFLQNMFTRVGGTVAVTNSDLDILSQFDLGASPETEKEIAAIVADQVPQLCARIAELEKQVNELRNQISFFR